jgi:undecaprenyl-diphosphatase
MQIIKYIILGIIQGITEPLPISSSGHLLIFRALFNTNMFNDFNFEIIVNFGSFLAIFLIFKEEIFKLIKDFFNFLKVKNEEKFKFKDAWHYGWMIIIASIPVGIMGLLFKSKLEHFSNVTTVGIALLITALGLIIVKDLDGQKAHQDITIKDAFFIGLMQMIALLPGLSRSGLTLMGGLIAGLKKEEALKFSFMLYFPVSIAAFGLSLIDVIKIGIDSSLVIPYISGLITAGIITYYTYNWLVSLVNNHKLGKFAIYCILMGLFTLYYFH